MKILSISIIAALLAASSVSAQNFKPVKGDWSIGVALNPMSIASAQKWQPENGNFSGPFVSSFGATEHSMYILGLDPATAIKLKYRSGDNMSMRFSIGFTGSVVNHKEYVKDDKAVFLNPLSTNMVTDVATTKLNGANFGFALEYNKSVGKLQFNGGIGLAYAIGGGSMEFKYGNAFDRIINGYVPTVMPMTNMAPKTLNEWVTGPEAIAWARPLKRYNAGYTSAFGLTADMGVEYFFSGRMSLTAALTMTPLIFLIQPETYTTYEGYSAVAGKVIQYNDKVSPGSNALLYGTQTLGINISFSYYL